MNKPTSFICEHTAEFALIPALRAALQSNFSAITPIFPWIAREGSNISKEIHANYKFRLLGVYPRRPKFTKGEYDKVHITINQEILIGAAAASLHGIPTIAGCPLATNLWELALEPRCCWIQLEGPSDDGYEIVIDLKSSKPQYTLAGNIILDNDQLLSYVNLNSKELYLEQAISAFKDIKMQSRGMNYYHNMAFMGGYKPIYLLLQDLNGSSPNSNGLTARKKGGYMP